MKRFWNWYREGLRLAEWPQMLLTMVAGFLAFPWVVLGIGGYLVWVARSVGLE